MEVSAFEAKVVQNNNNLFSIDHVVKEVGTIMDGAEYEVFHLSASTYLATGHDGLRRCAGIWPKLHRWSDC